MKNFLNYLETPLTWEFKKKKAFLKNDNQIILDLRTGKKRASFKLDDKTYDIRNTGFWNPVTVISEDKKKTASIKHFFRGSTSLLEFPDGSKYFIKCQNPVLIKLSIYSSDFKEILRYKLISKHKASFNFYFSNHEIPQSDVTLLIILGCFFFRGVIKENKLTNLESVIFSSTLPVKNIPMSATI